MGWRSGQRIGNICAIFAQYVAFVPAKKQQLNMRRMAFMPSSLYWCENAILTVKYLWHISKNSLFAVFSQRRFIFYKTSQNYIKMRL